MAALDLDVATRSFVCPPAPFSALAFGDQTLTPSIAPHPVRIVDDLPGIPTKADYPGRSTITSDIAVSVALHGATFIAFRGGFGLVASYTTPNAPMCYFNSGIMRDRISYAYVHDTSVIASETILTVPHTVDGISVYCFVNNSTAAFVANSLEGVIASVAPATTDPGLVTTSTDTTDGDSDDVDILGMWHFDNVEVSTTDAIDTMDAILAALSPETSDASGVGEWAISGTALASVNVEPTVPTTPTPPSGGSQSPPTKPTPATPSEMKSAGVYPIRHVFETMPAPTLVNDLPVGWTASSHGDDEYGYLQITVEGVDITLLDGVETPFPSWRRGEPFGPQSATIEVPQITTFSAMPSWAAHGANVSIDLVKIAGGSVSLFEGFVMDLGVNEDTGIFTLECLGVLFGADLTLRTPSFTTAPRDLGSLVPELLNKVAGRRWLSMASIVTGARTSVAGGWEPLLTGYIQQLLATAIKDGKQWTVRCEERTPELMLKDTTNIEASIRVGQRGYRVDVNSDATQAPNVIYGEGIAPDGGRWRNSKYPNWKPDDTPDYPNVNPADTMRQGRTDASTDSGNGISTWERKMGLPADGVLSAADVLAMKRLQGRSGITVDGVLGPQTWATTFNTGANTGSLDGAFIAPLAAAEEVMPRLYGPDGDDLGPNPTHDPDIIRVEDKINYGQDVTKAEGIANAEEVLARESDPGWAGIITFELDPPNKSRYEIREGDNWRLLGLHGQTVDVHTARVRFDEDFAICEVDSKARDYPTLEAIRTRDRNATDPAKVAQKRLLEGDIGTDRATYDAESPAGRMPRHAIFSGLWDVRQIPMGAYGRVVRTDFKTTSSAQPFALAVFGKPLTAADLVSAVGNPLSTATNPWSNEAVDDLGLLQAWGWASQPAGYYPDTYSNPNGETASPVTGRLLDDASWDYASERSPWLWVAAFAPAACFIEGRFYGAAD
ncbi:peptidoglycan-binding protein [Demequina sp. TTPB684]|uniref:peptidoglycan-binding domain-containing protein n=1 Tax=unclassified Demequina TaxID=2620311 RepID=UPI001CF57D22|nr:MULTISPECIES: peptidoglycan-binding domain-containing protein [unclassified Demequina]MCB2411785.1 peptidoglycan-binding protein [Demequina sp. TTPB684]UPU89014.1 peptidoglycan-binding protein [Demequina sp. TMPB413]